MINLNENTFNKLTHIIYYEWFLDIRGGGPTGYLANLLDGLNRVDSPESPLIFFDTDIKHPVPAEQPLGTIHQIAHNFFYRNERLKNLYTNYISRYQKNAYENYLNFLNHPEKIFCNQDLFKNINLNTTRTIHTHTVGDAVKVKNTLKQLGLHNIKVMLTCHTPEVPSNEYYKSYLEQGHNIKHSKAIQDGWKNVERQAFDDSDILVFPSPEAMEPLIETMPEFNSIIREKDIRFMATGAKKLTPKLTREEARKKYGVEGKFVIGYVGRHNEIKGYDILQEAAKQVLPKNPSTCFLIGGALGNTFSPLKHERWIEAGWVNPADLFMALDAFILPNRMTYYDLVLLEVMSMGIPVIASATGGNKSVQATTNSLILYNNTAADLAAKIIEFCNFSSNDIENLRNKTKASYDHNFTPIHFANRYKNMLLQIYQDYNLL